jgi:hypothetical protein
MVIYFSDGNVVAVFKSGMELQKHVIAILLYMRDFRLTTIR